MDIARGIGERDGEAFSDRPIKFDPQFQKMELAADLGNL
jgi:hypothetical protein